MKKISAIKTVTCVLLLGSGFLLGWYIRQNQKPVTFDIVRESQHDYKFIDPLLFLKVSENAASPKYLPLKDELSKYIDKAEKENITISAYMRDLNSINWIGVNNTTSFSPASMLKVITLISILHKTETDPNFLYTKVIIPQNAKLNTTLQDYYPPQHPIQANQTYTVQELISHLITESDNNANNALSGLVGSEEIEKTYKNLQIPLQTSLDSAITPQQYSHVFRSLYNASYLSHPLSEQVLKLLSETTFNKGITQGVPVGAMVSHKFGERTTSATQHELHDCGIIYYPDNPYFLCVMTKGSDFPTLEVAIKDISAIAWKGTEKLYSKGNNE